MADEPRDVPVVVTSAALLPHVMPDAARPVGRET
jgi:hypothetical protein